MMLLEQSTRFTLNWVQDLMNLVIKRGCNSNLKSKEYHSYERKIIPSPLPWERNASCISH